jgi:hypothetical protein
MSDLRGTAAIFEQMWQASEKECEELRVEIERLQRECEGWSKLRDQDIISMRAEIERLRAHLGHAAGFCEGMARRLEAGDVEHAAEDCHEYSEIALCALEGK